MNIRTKFYVTTKEEVAGDINRLAGWKIRLCAVYAGTADDGGNKCLENRIFSKNTPNASVEMFITNPAAAASIEVGREYYVDFTAAHPAKEVTQPA